MDSEDITEVVNFQPTAEFITAEELVALRKSKEEAAQPNIGLKYSTCSKSLLELKAVDCAIESYKDNLTKKLGARNCDFMYAKWNEELNAAVTSKLKGKFVQHMGHKIDDDIALSPEESLFLLENGCIEITNGKKPLSTEEAFAVMLKRNLSTEKYQVYLHLSQLGFIVVPHRKELNKIQGKSVHLEKSQKKRKSASPLPEDLSNKRLTFSGAFLEDTGGNKISNVSEGGENLANDIVPSTVEEPRVIDETEFKQLQKKELCENEEPLNLNLHECDTESLCCNGIENLRNGVNTESKVKLNEEPLSSTCIEEMDSRSTDISCCKDASDLENQNEVIGRLTSQNPQCAVMREEEDEEVNEDNSEVMSCSSNSQSFENGTEASQRSLCLDDEITLLEVTKKETTPLAVIDLLSDEEDQEDVEDDHLSGSDDDIKIIKVCNGPTDKEKATQETPLNLEKIKSRKMRDCKLEEARSAPNSSPSIQFPDVFRKDNVCVSKPSPNFLPLHLRPNKEVYILNLPRHSGHPVEQPQERLWNSYKDMQDYQRARRQNRHSNRPNPRFRNHDAKPWHRNFKHRDAGSSRDPRQTFARNDYISSYWDRASSRERRDIDFRDHDSPRTKEGGFRDVPRDQQNDVDYLNSSQDIKPCKRTTSPFGNVEQRNFPVNTFQCPQFPDTSSVNPLVSSRPPGLNFAFATPPPLNVNNFASTNMSHVISLEAPSFVAEVHRTAYSYATTMLSSMFGQAFNPSDIPHFMPFPSERSPFGSMRPPFSGVPNFNNFSSNFNVPNNEHFPVPNSRRSNNDYYRNRRPPRGVSFPRPYRNIYNKRSWNDVRTAVGGENGPSDNDTSDIEEIPIKTNEFLWNVTSLCPLVKPGIKHAVLDVLKPLRLTQMAKLTDKNTRDERCFPDEPSLEISFDVYLPGANFKKSCPGVPKHRIIVIRAQDPIPRYAEIAVLQRKWNDGAALQIAVVDNTDITFCSFNSVCLPDIVPFND